MGDLEVIHFGIVIGLIWNVTGAEGLELDHAVVPVGLNLPMTYFMILWLQYPSDTKNVRLSDMTATEVGLQ